MTKPAITKRLTKGSLLTYSELDTNFQNLADATIGVTDGTNSHQFNLNDTITFTAGSNVTLGVNPTTGAITISSASLTTGNIQWSYNSTSKLNTMDANVDPADSLTIETATLTVNASGLILKASSGAASITAPQELYLGHGSGYSALIGYQPGGSSSVDGVISTYTGKKLTLDTGWSGSGYSSSKIVINPGSNGNIELSPIGTGVVSASKSISSTVSAGTSQLDCYSNATTYFNGATVNFSNFSGMVMINRQDTSSGNVALWLCGGGVANKLGDSQANACGVIAGDGAVNGYTWTNNTGGTIIASFTAIRGRTSG